MTTSLQDAYIIIVEDDTNAQLVALDLLRLAGAKNCFARKSAASALAFAKTMPGIDLFLVDINMPGQSGYDMLQLIRQNETYQNSKVVAVTAGTLEEDVEQARALGFDGFISKPLKMSDFARQVQDILNDKRVWDWR
ncbi:MAG: response regulator [Chloroflexota bacterium]|jgi:CheY-like chemotaxis protein